MKKLIFTLATILSTAFISSAQKPSIAVGNPAVNGLFNTTPTIASKLIRLELIKMDQYAVYDEYDMKDLYEKDKSFENDCLSKSCLTRMGEALEVNYTVSGSYDVLGNKIVISLKIIDIKNKTIFKSAVREFDDQEHELQRMTEILLKEMHNISIDEELSNRLKFNNEVVTSNNVGKINNSGPRIGMAMMTGDFHEFATRSESQGGLDIFPAVSMIGYQFEAQYVGTENFSALFEGIFNISGLEQGRFMPSISLMNGFRFGKAGWEFAFGPGFSLTKESAGFFDKDGLFGEKDAYFNQEDWYSYASREYADENAYPEYYENGYFTTPTPDQFNSDYNFDNQHMDDRGATKLSTQFVFAFGRTFKAGALNIPVNVFYTSKKGGGMVGLNVGFNIMKSKKPINQKNGYNK